jgi:hypothetical protein
LTQEDQVRCFQNVAAHLDPSGVFVIEAFVPDLKRFQDWQTVRATRISVEEIQLDVSMVDPVSQQVTTQHILLSDQGARLFPVKLRYAWPAEFDLMAHIAGMHLKHRWGSWEKGVFSAGSGKHISIYSR